MLLLFIFVRHSSKTRYRGHERKNGRLSFDDKALYTTDGKREDNNAFRSSISCHHHHRVAVCADNCTLFCCDKPYVVWTEGKKNEKETRRIFDDERVRGVVVVVVVIIVVGYKDLPMEESLMGWKNTLLIRREVEKKREKKESSNTDGTGKIVRCSAMVQ